MNQHARIEADTAGEASNLPIPRATIDAIVRRRDDALALYVKAHAAMTVGAEASAAAHSSARKINPRDEDRYTHHLHSDKSKFMGVADVQPLEDYVKVATRIVDTEAWAHVIAITDLERLMDKKAKGELYQSLLENPPAATVDNIRATLQQFMLDADMIFRRGIANCFSNLDRRFRSHDGFKIGHRLILDRMFSEHGSWNYHRDMESTLLDIERTLLVIDGRKVPGSWSGIVGKLRNARRGFHAQQTEVEDEFFTVRAFKNGNCHVWFKRPDLLEKVNKLLAEYYGEVIPDGMTPEDDGGLFEPKTSLAKNYGFFPTPEGPAQTVREKLHVLRPKKQPQLRLLEPSAGTGNLAKLFFTSPMKPEGKHDWQIKRAREHNEEYRFDNAVDCVEIQPGLAAGLRAQRRYRKVYACDFLSLKPETTGLYHIVGMNPPFDRERDIDHVVHALDFLEPDGLLVAIMSAGTEFRETRKSTAFRALIAKMGGKFTDLPAGSFSSVGTNVNTIILRVWKDGRKVSW